MKRKMFRVEIKYNPYLRKTDIWINGVEIKENKFLASIQGRKLEEWVEKFPEFLRKLESSRFSIIFYGVSSDWYLIKGVILNAVEKKKLPKLTLRYKAPAYYKDYIEKIAKDFCGLRKELIIDDPENNELIQTYEKIRRPYFRIHVVATMSAGKSTLINAMLGRRLLPSQNEACTASIIELLDTDQKKYEVSVYDSQDRVLKKYQDTLDKVENISADDLARLNQIPEVARISIRGDIPFVDSRGTALMLVDTPGTNNSKDMSHRDMTFREICKDDRSILLYVLNATQIGTNDDDELLSYVSRQIRAEGKAAENRIIFAVNKMDAFNPEEEDIEGAVKRIKVYLSHHGINNPRIFVCSAKIALQVRTELKNIDLMNLSRTKVRQLPVTALETLPLVNKVRTYDKMHFEKYATVSPALMREINERLKTMEKKGNIQEQVLIHSGVYSLEKYIALYVKARTAKDLMKFLEDTLDNSIM